MNKPTLAIIVPCYNEQDVVAITHKELGSLLKTMINEQKVSSESYICFVDDGSNDKTWEQISEFAREKEVKGIKLSTNFGHQAAQLAGLAQCEADVFITIDADLQDDIKLIPQMIEKFSQGYDVVCGVRSDRDSDSFFKKHISQFYYHLAKKLGVRGTYNHADFRLMSAKVVDILKNLKERNLYLRGIISSLGFPSCNLYFSRLKRVAGDAKYNFFSMSALAIDGITSFSTTPLRVITFIGVFCFIIALFMSVFSVFSYFESKIVPGWASLFTSIYFLGGVQLLSIGIIGEYIGKIYKETKQRPNFIVEKFID